MLCSVSGNLLAQLIDNTLMFIGSRVAFASGEWFHAKTPISFPRWEFERGVTLKFRLSSHAARERNSKFSKREGFLNPSRDPAMTPSISRLGHSNVSTYLALFSTTIVATPCKCHRNIFISTYDKRCDQASAGDRMTPETKRSARGARILIVSFYSMISKWNEQASTSWSQPCSLNPYQSLRPGIPEGSSQSYSYSLHMHSFIDTTLYSLAFPLRLSLEILGGNDSTLPSR